MGFVIGPDKTPHTIKIKFREVMTIEWNEHLSTTIDWQDKEHQELISKFNHLYRKIEDQAAEEEVSAIISFLDYYILHHFNHEEMQMEETQYPEYESHRNQHMVFNENFSAIKDEFEEKGESHELAEKVLHSMLEWFIKHIMTVDKSLGDYLREAYSSR